LARLLCDNKIAGYTSVPTDTLSNFKTSVFPWNFQELVPNSVTLWR